jgi:hypothetical protein
MATMHVYNNSYDFSQDIYVLYYNAINQILQFYFAHDQDLREDRLCA